MALQQNKKEQSEVMEVIPIQTRLYDDTKDHISFENKEQLIFVTSEYRPYVYMENGEIKGIVGEMMTTTLDEMGADYDILVYSWTRGQYLLDMGEIFGAFPYAITDARLEKYIFTDSMLDVKKAKDIFYYYSEDTQALSNLEFEDLQKYRVGGIGGYYYLDDLDQLGISYDLSSNEAECFKKLVEGRIDLFPIDERVGDDFIKRNYPELEQNFHKSNLYFKAKNPGNYIMLNKNHPLSERFTLAFNQMFYQLRTTGKIYNDFDE
ncbi:MAG: extracellular solute-binding protein [uncultured bacterium (gcode 4)]|uniref:Extracellular solute-binding protein n=1 Tax=uncultured bacterium (gcode 4) TaxID=1234023 RepID=K1X5K8_9BACT|nr:MAG: extracellular solute-binding protein [uncultured bacterium (gcode 4)]